MATSGPNNPGTTGDDASIGTVAWASTANIASSNNVYATASLDAATSHYITATNFGFAIPTGATINGVTAEVERSYSGAGTTMRDESVKLIKGGTIQGTDKSGFVGFGFGDSYQSFGGAADLWGLTLTPGDVNASNFGVAYAGREMSGGGARTLQCDHMRITITYTPATSLPLAPPQRHTYRALLART